MFLHSDFDDTHRELFHTVEAWAKKTLAPGAAERDREASFDEALYRRLDTELGLMNITLPESSAVPNSMLQRRSWPSKP